MSFALPEQFQSIPDRRPRHEPTVAHVRAVTGSFAGHPHSPSWLARLVMRPPEGAWTVNDQDAFDTAVGFLVVIISGLTVLCVSAGLLVAAVI